MGKARKIWLWPPVQAGTIQDALSAIGKSFELDGYDNPLYINNTNQFHP